MPVQQVPVLADISVAAAVRVQKARAVVVPVAPKAAPPIAAPSGKCDPSYPDICTPSPDLDCPEISYRSFRVTEPTCTGSTVTMTGSGARK